MYEPESVWEFSTAKRIKFGDNAVTEIGPALTERNIDSALIITDPGIRETGIIDDVVDELDEINYEVFDDVEPDPSVETFERAVDTVREQSPDALIGVGGGSSMDVTKTASIVAPHGGEILDYVAPPTGEGKRVPGPGLLTVCVPTTAGTGAETSPASVLSLPDQQTKVGISSRYQCPDLAVVDPLMTVSLPPEPTASSGIDALCHAIESYTTRRYDAKSRPDDPRNRPDYNGGTPITDQFARQAIELVGNNLRRVVNNGEDVEARRKMARASLSAGIAFTNAGLGAAHAMAMVVGAEYHTPHGTTIAAVLPSVMRHNASSAFNRYAWIADVLGKSVDDLSEGVAAEAAADAVERLIADVGQPSGLGELGVEEGDIGRLASKTIDLQRLMVGNPRRITKSEMELLYRQAL